MKTFQTLYEFVDTAARSRKYPENTATGLRAALKMFEAELSQEEAASLDVFKARLDPIYQSVFQKNAKNFSASSIATYKSRVVKVLNDYQSYGIDPTKMTSWSPKLITRAKKSPATIPAAHSDSPVATVPISDPIISENMHKIELALRPDVKFVIIIPRDITKAESVTVNSIISSLVAGNN